MKTTLSHQSKLEADHHTHRPTSAHQGFVDELGCRIEVDAHVEGG